MSIEANSHAPDQMRANLHASGPFRIIDGRGIIDNQGRVIVYAVAGETLDDNGRIRSWRAGRGDINACQADENVHAIALILNNPLLWALQYARERAQNDAPNAEFWRRLAGSICKGMMME